ncbi:MAG: type IV pilus assembly protein PilM [Armatimonadetes bacterium]|nr:type IV pilus assembly protein PilM [Armatimonadota bacterium]
MARNLLDRIFGEASAVAIDIGSTSIKLMECRSDGDRVVVSRMGMGPTPPGALLNGAVVDALIVGEVIRDLLRSTGSNARLALSAVTDPSLVATRIQVPRRDDASLDKAMPFEARSHVPFGAEEGQLTWQVLNPRDTSPQMEVLLVAARNEAIDGRLQALEAAGLTPVVMDAVQFALLRSQVYASPDPRLFERTVLLLHIGTAFTEMAVVWRGCFAFPRIVPIAGAGMDQALAAAFSVDVEEARRIKETRAAAAGLEELHLLPEEQQQAAQAISPVLDEIVRDTQTSLNFLASSFQMAGGEAGADEVIVSGGVSRLPRLAEYLQARLHTPVRIFDVFRDTRLEAPDYDPSFLADMSPYLSVVAGLALRESMAGGAYPMVGVPESQPLPVTPA